MEIRELLEQNGYKVTDFGDSYRIPALYRNGSNALSVSVKKSDGSFYDHGQSSGGSFKKLVSLITTKTGKELDELLIKFNNNEQIQSAPIQKIKKKMIYPPEILDRLLPIYDLYLEEGIEKS